MQQMVGPLLGCHALVFAHARESFRTQHVVLVDNARASSLLNGISFRLLNHITNVSFPFLVPIVVLPVWLIPRIVLPSDSH